MTVMPISKSLMSFDCAPCRPSLGQRITTIGLPGASKTTLARHLSEEMAMPHSDRMPSPRWGANWTATPPPRFCQVMALTH